jgi:hypothetical protein
MFWDSIVDSIHGDRAIMSERKYWDGRWYNSYMFNLTVDKWRNYMDNKA